MSENNTELSIAFIDSIGVSFSEVLSERIEPRFDDMLCNLDDGLGYLFDGLPIIKAMHGVYKVSQGFLARRNLKKIAIFINRVNECIVTEEQVNRYKAKLIENEKYRNEQIAYILAIVEKYTDFEKPKILASLFVAFLDGQIDWEEFTCYSEIIDRFLPGDYEALARSASYCLQGNDIPAPILRLIGLGLVVDVSQFGVLVPTGRRNVGITARSIEKAIKCEREFLRTGFGEKLVSIIQGDCSGSECA